LQTCTATLEQQLNALEKLQLVELCLAVVKDLNFAHVFEKHFSVPSITAINAELKCFLQAIDKAAPRYADFNHFHVVVSYPLADGDKGLTSQTDAFPSATRLVNLKRFVRWKCDEIGRCFF